MINGWEFLKDQISKDQRGLEIGPHARGLAPKREGYNVSIIDYQDADALKATYPGPERDCVEAVDFIQDGRPLTDLVGERGTFSYFAASHVIEHMPDLVGFLKQAETLLSETGKLLLVVPDHRLFMDAFRPLTTVGQVMDRHLAGATKHTPGSILDGYAYAVHRGPDVIWLPDTQHAMELHYGFDRIRAEFDRARSDSAYIDAHAWTFTPSSFRLLISDLYDLGEIALRETAFAIPPTYPYYTSEFYAVLSKDGEGHRLTRNDLMARVRAELAGWYGANRAVPDVP